MAHKRHWSESLRRPKDICEACSHPRMDHLDNPRTKGEPPDSDRGWCTLPKGSCIFAPCKCSHFVEPRFVFIRTVAYYIKRFISEHRSNYGESILSKCVKSYFTSKCLKRPGA